MNRPLGRNHESGQLTVLIIGYALIAVTLVAVVVNASNAFLHRRSLSSWADGAVVVAAQNLAYDDLYGGGPVTTLPVAESAAREAVLGYARRHDLGARFDGFRVDDVSVDPSSGRVTVTLGASVPLVLLRDLVGERAAVTITADATAVSPFD